VGPGTALPDNLLHALLLSVLLHQLKVLAAGDRLAANRLQADRTPCLGLVTSWGYYVEDFLLTLWLIHSEDFSFRTLVTNCADLFHKCAILSLWSSHVLRLEDVKAYVPWISHLWAQSVICMTVDSCGFIHNSATGLTANRFVFVAQRILMDSRYAWAKSLISLITTVKVVTLCNHVAGSVLLRREVRFRL